MKESISDIINQLQDIDPARLSFSPFLDLDTQISLAPVSDSPESSVEELHSSSHSVSGSQRSLEPPPATDQPKSELLLLLFAVFLLELQDLRGGQSRLVKARVESESRLNPKGVKTQSGLIKQLLSCVHVFPGARVMLFKSLALLKNIFYLCFTSLCCSGVCAEFDTTGKVFLSSTLKPEDVYM